MIDACNLDRARKLAAELFMRRWRSGKEVMRAARFETTLQGPCTVTGRGYWSGQLNTLSLLPAPAGTGIRFFRDDLGDRVGVAAVAENCQPMSLRTCLADGPLRFEMIEHVLAALIGLQVDNVLVRCTAAEMPGLDGSSYPLAAAIAAVGKVLLPRRRATLCIDRPLRVGDDRQWICIEPAANLSIEYRLDYGAESPIGQATFQLEVDEDLFYQEVAPARTFITRAEADVLRSRGLAEHVTERDLLVFDQHGPVNNRLRYTDECARHKWLDVLGDLAVAGVDVVGKITACRSGHQLNGQLARQLRALYRQSLQPVTHQQCQSRAA